MAEAAFVIFLVDRFFRNSNCVILSLIVAGLLLGINYDCLNGFTSIELLNSINNAFYGLVNICIVEKITKFDNDIFLDFRAAGESFAGSTIRLRTACP